MTRGDNANDGKPSATRMNAFRPWAIGALFVLGLVAVVAISAAASADGRTDHRLCMGDTQHVDHPEGVGSGCVTGWIETEVDCSGSGPDYQCTLEGKLGVRTEGLKTCGTTRGSWFEDPALACTNVADALQGWDDDETEWQHLKTYTAEEIPDEGMTVVIPVEVCAWADHTNVHEDAVRCSTFDHTDWIPGDPTASDGPVEMVSNLVMGEVDHAVTTVENSDPPVSVSP